MGRPGERKGAGKTAATPHPREQGASPYLGAPPFSAPARQHRGRARGAAGVSPCASLLLGEALPPRRSPPLPPSFGAHTQVYFLRSTEEQPRGSWVGRSKTLTRLRVGREKGGGRVQTLAHAAPAPPPVAPGAPAAGSGPRARSPRPEPALRRHPGRPLGSLPRHTGAGGAGLGSGAGAPPKYSPCPPGLLGSRRILCESFRLLLREPSLPSPPPPLPRLSHLPHLLWGARNPPVSALPSSPHGRGSMVPRPRLGPWPGLGLAGAAAEARLGSGVAGGGAGPPPAGRGEGCAPGRPGAELWQQPLGEAPAQPSPEIVGMTAGGIGLLAARQPGGRAGGPLGSAAAAPRPEPPSRTFPLGPRGL